MSTTELLVAMGFAIVASGVQAQSSIAIGSTNPHKTDKIANDPTGATASLALTVSDTPTSSVRKGETASIHMVYMGGNDCPPCVAWRAKELPLLRQTAAFQTVTFSYVQKVIASAVPPSFFLPTDVKPLKEKLDFAGGGRGGSAQVAILVDGEVYDYYFGSRSSSEVERMILSIRNGTKYPFERCLKRDLSKGCALKGP